MAAAGDTHASQAFGVDLLIMVCRRSTDGAICRRVPQYVIRQNGKNLNPSRDRENSTHAT